MGLEIATRLLTPDTVYFKSQFLIHFQIQCQAKRKCDSGLDSELSLRYDPDLRKWPVWNRDY